MLGKIIFHKDCHFLLLWEKHIAQTSHMVLWLHLPPIHTHPAQCDWVMFFNSIGWWCPKNLKDNTWVLETYIITREIRIAKPRLTWMKVRALYTSRNRMPVSCIAWAASWDLGCRLDIVIPNIFHFECNARSSIQRKLADRIIIFIIYSGFQALEYRICHMY